MNSFLKNLLLVIFTFCLSGVIARNGINPNTRILPDSYGQLDCSMSSGCIVLCKKGTDEIVRDMFTEQSLSLVATDSGDNYVFRVTDTSFYYYSVSADKLSGPISISNDWSHFFNYQRISEYDFKVRGDDSIVFNTDVVIMEEYLFEVVKMVYVKSKGQCFVLKEEISQEMKEYFRRRRYFKEVESVVNAYKDMKWPMRHLKMGVFVGLILLLNIFLARGKF